MRKERKIAGKEEDYFVLCRRIENEKSFFQKHFLIFVRLKIPSLARERGVDPDPHAPVRVRFSLDPPC